MDVVGGGGGIPKFSKLIGRGGMSDLRLQNPGTSPPGPGMGPKKEGGGGSELVTGAGRLWSKGTEQSKVKGKQELSSDRYKKKEA